MLREILVGLFLAPVLYTPIGAWDKQAEALEGNADVSRQTAAPRGAKPNQSASGESRPGPTGW